MAVEVRFLVGERPQQDKFPDAESVGVDDAACLVVLRNPDSKDEEILAVYAPGMWISAKVIADASDAP